jgi:hypothetical protein
VDKNEVEGKPPNSVGRRQKVGQWVAPCWQFGSASRPGDKSGMPGVLCGREGVDMAAPRVAPTLGEATESVRARFSFTLGRWQASVGCVNGKCEPGSAVGVIVCGDIQPGRTTPPPTRSCPQFGRRLVKDSWQHVERDDG